MTTDATPYTFPDNRRGTVAGVFDAARALLGSTREPPAARQLHQQELAANAKALAGNVASQVKARPIPPVLIAAGIGLVFLFSKRARGAALTAGTFALDQYRKR
ncbi:MAG: hypothetical protein Q8J89_12375 [Caulobacter sp.]|nr:hypothetical protein [Caulobacter sp.]